MLERVRNLDIFAIPFAYQQGRENNKNRTKLGGILSILIFFISFTYLIYLAHGYFGNKINPTTTTL